MFHILYFEEFRFKLCCFGFDYVFLCDLIRVLFLLILLGFLVSDEEGILSEAIFIFHIFIYPIRFLRF